MRPEESVNGDVHIRTMLTAYVSYNIKHLGRQIPSPRGFILWLSLRKLSSFLSFAKLFFFIRTLPSSLNSCPSSAINCSISSLNGCMYSGCAIKSYKAWHADDVVVWIAANDTPQKVSFDTQLQQKTHTSFDRLPFQVV